MGLERVARRRNGGGRKDGCIEHVAFVGSRDFPSLPE